MRKENQQRPPLTNEQTDRQSYEFTVRELLQIQDIWIRVSYLQQCFQSVNSIVHFEGISLEEGTNQAAP